LCVVELTNSLLLHFDTHLVLSLLIYFKPSYKKQWVVQELSSLFRYYEIDEQGFTHYNLSSDKYPEKQDMQ